ncbi:MAG TPA: carboxypeptidase regulatory-like domain-containing protein [Bryobacteraceae bacterium]|nr:carboxypeptidase regulatory-like domain-containing protein [Bryobacteraceae bacterium]
MTRSTALLPLFVLLTFAGENKLNAQAADGNLVGTVIDQTGASIPGADVEITHTATGITSSTTTGMDGGYRFNNVLVGAYNIKISRTGFAAAVLRNTEITLNTTSTANATLTVGDVSTAVDVTDAATLIDTTTAQIGSTFGSRQAIDVPSASLALGALNLSLLNAGVASSGGIGAGEGPSVGGLRPRSNNFTVEGIDNNSKYVTGHIIDIPNEAVQEFSALQNSFSAEFGNGGGGQFNQVLRNGGNQFHGAAFEYLENRNLNAVDQAFARIGVLSNPRFDSNLFGGSIGGPILKNKLFFYGLYQYNPTGQATTPSPVESPTAAGYSALSAIPGLSQTNLGVLQKYLPAAPTANQSTVVNGVSIPIGILPIVAPSYTNESIWLINIDYNISDKDQLRGRAVNESTSGFSSNTLPELVAFFQGRNIQRHLFMLEELHTFTPTLLNEVRLGYTRSNDNIPSGNYTYPGLTAFPNIVIQNDLGVQIGPAPVSPQSTVLNTYQLIDNITWTKGRHTLKFGAEGRKYISAITFTGNLRGDYEYSNLQRFLLDQSPNLFNQRAGDAGPFSGNSISSSFFVNDQYRMRPNFTINLGLRYDYQGISAGDKLQTLNAFASVPGLISFQAPTPQLDGFAPRIGLAYSPGTSGRTSVRAGFGLSYDKSFDNLSVNLPPPELSNVITGSLKTVTPNFLANGGLQPTTGLTTYTTAAAAQAATANYKQDQYLMPYALNWNIGVEHVFHNDYTLEVRYLGTRGVHLPTQSWLNYGPVATPALNIPTFLTTPSAQTLATLPHTTNDLYNIDSVLAPWRANFDGLPITSYLFRGNSIYHGLATEFSRRFSKGLFFKTSYTWSHALDDSTADVKSTLLAPRRPQDFSDMKSEWGTSFLDRRHRLTQTLIWDTPWFNTSANELARYALGGYVFSGTYTYESPQYVTVQSGLDSNLNGDSAGDRAIVNPNGVPNTSSGVRAVNASGATVQMGDSSTVAYIANNPNAQYITAGYGALATGGRNTMALRPINNFDLQIKKVFPIGEAKRLEFAAQLFNAFNHPQYTAGFTNNVLQTQTLGVSQQNLVIPGNPLFDRPDLAFSSNPRSIQLTARFQF